MVSVTLLACRFRVLETLESYLHFTMADKSDINERACLTAAEADVVQATCQKQHCELVWT
jgi:hypothetical protein